MTCTVVEEPYDLPLHAFRSRYRDAELPVVVRNATWDTGAHFRQITALDELARQWGRETVTLSSANAFSYGRVRMKLSQYLATMGSVRWDDDSATGEAADRIYYYFGEHGSEIQSLLDEVHSQSPQQAMAPHTLFAAVACAHQHHSPRHGLRSTRCRASLTSRMTATKQPLHPGLSPRFWACGLRGMQGDIRPRHLPRCRSELRLTEVVSRSTSTTTAFPRCVAVERCELRAQPQSI